MKETSKTLYIVTPCYNEEKVLPITYKLFVDKINELININKISKSSKVVFVNDGSSDSTWEIIKELSRKNEVVEGLCLSRNRGHQNALLAGLLESKDLCDVTITMDCDGQHDISVVDKMLEEYNNGNEIVYGIRNNRAGDGKIKSFLSELFYKIISSLGGEVIPNHADYRLVSSKVLKEFANYKEVNIFLRGMFPMVGFKSTTIKYDQFDRAAGKSHYPFKKSLALAIDGITSMSIKPIRLITGFGVLVTVLSFIEILYTIIEYLIGNTVQGWASMTCIICFVSGVQLISLGIIGEYVGKTYLETKQRPRYIISESTINK